MDLKTCKHCYATIGNRTHCPNCGKSQKTNTLFIVVSVIIGLFLLCSLVFQGTVNLAAATETVITAVTPISTLTAIPTITPTANLIITTPSAVDSWTKIHPGLYARRADNRSDCFEMGTGIEYCAGQPVEYYSTSGRWIVAWENSWSKTREEIIPGEANLVYVPSDATNIHWEWGVPGCDSLFIEKCLGN